MKILFSILVLGLFIGCGSKSGNTDNPNNPTQTTPKTTTVKDDKWCVANVSNTLGSLKKGDATAGDTADSAVVEFIKACKASYTELNPAKSGRECYHDTVFSKYQIEPFKLLYKYHFQISCLSNREILSILTATVN